MSNDVRIVDAVDVNGRLPGFYALASFNGLTGTPAGPMQSVEEAQAFIDNYIEGARAMGPALSIIAGEEVNIDKEMEAGKAVFGIEEVPA